MKRKIEGWYFTRFVIHRLDFVLVSASYLLPRNSNKKKKKGNKKNLLFDLSRINGQ
jgi:hypothetical protein